MGSVNGSNGSFVSALPTPTLPVPFRSWRLHPLPNRLDLCGTRTRRCAPRGRGARAPWDLKKHYIFIVSSVKLRDLHLWIMLFEVFFCYVRGLRKSAGWQRAYVRVIFHTLLATIYGQKSRSWKNPGCAPAYKVAWQAQVWIVCMLIRIIGSSLSSKWSLWRSMLFDRRVNSSHRSWLLHNMCNCCKAHTMPKGWFVQGIDLGTPPKVDEHEKLGPLYHVVN